MLPSPRRYAVGPNETARRPPGHSADVDLVAPVGLVPPSGPSIDDAFTPSGQTRPPAGREVYPVMPYQLLRSASCRRTGPSIDDAFTPSGQTRPPAGREVCPVMSFQLLRSASCRRTGPSIDVAFTPSGQTRPPAGREAHPSIVSSMYTRPPPCRRREAAPSPSC
jgi:hypothetical protein